MNTLKTIIVVAVLLAVLYGVYVLLNKPDLLSPRAEDWPEPAMPALNIEGGAPIAQPPGGAPAGPWAVAATPPTLQQPPVAGSTQHANLLGATGYSGSISDTRLVPPQPSPSLANNGSEPYNTGEVAAPPPWLEGKNVIGLDNRPQDVRPQDVRPQDLSSPGDYSREIGGPVDLQAPLDPAPAEAGGRFQNTSVAANTTFDNAAPFDGSGAPNPTSTEPLSSSTGSAAFEKTYADALRDIAAGKFRGPLAALTVYYRHPDLSFEQAERLQPLLDGLAGKVIYSPEHLLEPPYVTRRGESLPEVAQRMNVPWELLRNIHRETLASVDVLPTGEQIKAFRGPFRAEADLAAGVLTLYLEDLYAGHFPITAGGNPPISGKYVVRDKSQGQDYLTPQGETIPARHPDNPYGRHYLSLGGDAGLHALSHSGQFSQAGSIRLSPVDAEDVYNILSAGSKVEVIR